MQNVRCRFWGFALLAGLMLGAQGALAQTSLADSSSGLLEWTAPPATRHTAQTPAQEEIGKTKGRPLPAPELLQPTLDPALPVYHARRDLHLSGTFKVSASDVLPHLVRRWITGFERDYPHVHLMLSPPFAGSLGAVALANGKIDVAVVSRELRPSDITLFKAHYGYPPLSVAVSGGSYRQFGFLDSVVFVVNKDNPIDQLSFDQLDQILSATHARGGTAITTWGQLGLTGDWASRPIHIYGIKPWNGFEEFVRQRVLSANGRRGQWRDGIAFAKTVFPIAGEVAKDPDGIGYTGMAFVDAPVKLLALQAEAGKPYYPPTYENVASADYPLSRLVYLNLNRVPGKPLDPALQQFLLYILSRQGQQDVLDQAIYLPLRARQVDESRKLIMQ